MARKQQRTNAPLSPTLGICPCGKQGHRSRAAARAVGRRLDYGQISAYECPMSPPYATYWHLGHLPPVVRRGMVERNNVSQAVRAK